METEVVPLYRRATESELQLVGGNWKYGAFFSTILTQPNQYIPWAKHKYVLFFKKIFNKVKFLYLR